MTSPRLFHGWIVVWAAFGCTTVIFGVAYSFAAFFEPFARAFGAQRAEVSWVFGVSSLLFFSLGAVGGALADRFGPRTTAVAGMACIALGLLLSSFAGDLRTIYFAYGLGIGLGVALTYTPSMGAVQPWFLRQRGLASGIASSGIGAGTLVVPLAAAWLIDAAGWRGAMRWMAAATLALGCAVAWLLERDPAARGLAPDGVPGAAGAMGSAAAIGATGASGMSGAGIASGATGTPGVSGAPRAAGLRLGETVRTAEYRWLYLATLAAGIPMFIPFAHLSAAARDRGIGEAEAVALVGLIGIGSLVGRFGIGALADRLGRLQTHVVAQAVLGASFLLWWLDAGYAAYALFALVFGLSYGGIVSLLPPICSDLFGLRAVSGTIGLLYTGAGFGALIGPVAAGALFDRYGGYQLAIALCMVASALATSCAWRVWRLGTVAPGRAGVPG